jgi:Spy/CpxP family protein refolding chaperone
MRGRPLLAAFGALVGVTLSGVGMAPPATAEPPGPWGPPGHSPARFIQENAERLGLDAETRATIEKIATGSRDAERDLRSRIHAAHEQMRELLDADQPDEAAVMAQADAIGALELEGRKQMLSALLRIRALLTPEQRAELVRIREELGPPHGPPWHHRDDAGCEPPPEES